MTEVKNNLLKYDSSVIWSLPCLFQYEVVLGAIQKSLEQFGLDMLNVNAFGSPATVWSGGRAPVVRSNPFNLQTLKKLYNYVYHENNAVPTLTFSRVDITQDDLKDKNANLLLDFFIEREARFIVSSDILRDYIKKKNDKTVVVASILKSIHRFQGANKAEEPTIENETNYYNKLLKEYDIVVVRPEYSQKTLLNKPDLIDDISRTEILINQLCYSNCPNAPAHNILDSSKHLANDNEEYKTFCYRKVISVRQGYVNNSAHTQEEVQKLIKNGVRHIKLQGRGDPVPYYITAINLTSQMFNFDGPNSILLHSLFRDELVKEYSKFQKFVDPEGLWRFNSNISGLQY